MASGSSRPAPQVASDGSADTDLRNYNAAVEGRWSEIEKLTMAEWPKTCMAILSLSIYEDDPKLFCELLNKFSVPISTLARFRALADSVSPRIYSFLLANGCTPLEASARRPRSYSNRDYSGYLPFIDVGVGLRNAYRFLQANYLYLWEKRIGKEQLIAYLLPFVTPRSGNRDIFYTWFRSRYHTASAS